MSEQVLTQLKTQSIHAELIPVSHGVFQRCSNGVECAECRKKREATLQRAAVNSAPAHGVPSIVHDVLRSPGQSLDAGTRTFMESRFAHDFSGVRVHADDRAAASARAVNALAYTVGCDVVFGAGQYAPDTTAGKRLLAHELTHVVQQRGFQADHMDRYSIASANSCSEKEAETVTHALLSSKNLPTVVHPSGAATLARLLAPVPEVPTEELDIEDDVEAEKDLGPKDVVRYGPHREPRRRTNHIEYWDPYVRELHMKFDIIEAERPVATLESGGSPPDFITVEREVEGIWSWGHARYRVRAFHVLDAIEYTVGRANSEDDLERIQETYIDPLPLQKRRLRITWEPLFPQDFDPRAVVRTEVYNRALEKRIKVVPSLARAAKKSVAKEDEEKKSKCEEQYPYAIPIRWPSPVWHAAPAVRGPDGRGDPGSYDTEYDLPDSPLLIKRGSTFYNPDRPEIGRYLTRIQNPPFNITVPSGLPVHHKFPLYLGGPGNEERAEGEYDPKGRILAHPNLVVMSTQAHKNWHRVLANQPLGPRRREGPSERTRDGTPFCVLDLM